MFVGSRSSSNNNRNTNTNTHTVWQRPAGGNNLASKNVVGSTHTHPQHAGQFWYTCCRQWQQPARTPQLCTVMSETGTLQWLKQERCTHRKKKSKIHDRQQASSDPNAPQFYCRVSIHSLNTCGCGYSSAQGRDIRSTHRLGSQQTFSQAERPR